MAKQIIVLTREVTSTDQTLTVAFWFQISSGMQTTTSNSVWTGATSTENAAIQAGTVKEELNSFTYPIGLAPGDIEADLLQRWTNRNNQIGGVGPAVYYGVYQDPVAITTNNGWS